MDAEAKHAEIMKREGVRAANEWLRVLIEPLENLLNIAADDGDIKKLSEELAFKCREKPILYGPHSYAVVCFGLLARVALSLRGALSD